MAGINKAATKDDITVSYEHTKKKINSVDRRVISLELCAELTARIKLDLYDYLRNRTPDFSFNTLYGFLHLGYYDGTVIIHWIAIAPGTVVNMHPWYVIIDGVYLGRGHYTPVFAWNNGRFISLIEAHSNGYLTRGDLLRASALLDAFYASI